MPSPCGLVSDQPAAAEGSTSIAIDGSCSFAGPLPEVVMNEITQILSTMEQGEPRNAEDLLPLVYDELRKLAVQRLAHEAPGHTLQATALVHEAYVRLVDGEQARSWEARSHFFAAAAEAMRRILIETARRKQAEKHGGRHSRQALEGLEV